MLYILKKEINQFFGSLVGYAAIGIFLVLTGLLVWIFPSNGILDNGYADLYAFFYDTAPYTMIIVCSAITMRMLSEEYDKGTIEFLFTKPITSLQIVLGKYFSALVVITICILLTAGYYFTVKTLAAPAGSVDTAAIIGSYIGLFLLCAAYLSIGVLASALTKNQIVAFFLSGLLCFFFYQGFQSIAQLPVFFGSTDYFVEQLGMNAHYVSLSRGVIDTRDVIYFLVIIALVLGGTNLIINSRR